MTTSAFPLPASHTTTRDGRRLLGALGMLAAPMFLVQWIAGRVTGGDVQTAFSSAAARYPRAVALLGAAYLVGWACSAVGIRRMRATGRGAGAATIFAIQCIGLTLAMLQQVQDFTGTQPLGATFYGVCDVAWPLSHVFMLVVGAAVLRARVWAGWRRWTPLACGVALPLAFLVMALFGRAAFMTAFPFVTAATFFALGLAVATAPDIAE